MSALEGRRRRRTKGSGYVQFNRGKWCARWRDETGRLRVKRCNSIEEAERHLDQHALVKNQVTDTGVFASDEEWFWSHIDKSGDCWEWKSNTNTDGYGRFSWRGSFAAAHRIAYELTKGRIPNDMVVCHACDNPSCCNPDHLWVGTLSDNARDSVRKGRWGGWGHEGGVKKKSP